MSESFPCLICGKVLQRETDQWEAQPREGIMCSSQGNYGSAFFDPMDGTTLHFNICDQCVQDKAEEGVLFVARSWEPVMLQRMGMVGVHHVDVTYIPWDGSFDPSDGKRMEIGEDR